jgi:hypothetical protein
VSVYHYSRDQCSSVEVWVFQCSSEGSVLQGRSVAASDLSLSVEVNQCYRIAVGDQCISD